MLMWESYLEMMDIVINFWRQCVYCPSKPINSKPQKLSDQEIDQLYDRMYF